MNVYKISANRCLGWDAYDSAIVTANSLEEARYIHPADINFKGYNEETRQYDLPWWKGKFSPLSSGWTEPENVIVEFVGTTDVYTEPTIILASFNAG